MRFDATSQRLSLSLRVGVRLPFSLSQRRLCWFGQPAVATQTAAATSALRLRPRRLDCHPFVALLPATTTSGEMKCASAPVE